MLGADANRGDSAPHPRARSCPTRERTDPLLDSCLTQDHGRGTSGRKRRVCEHQEEQEATRDQGCAAGAEVGTHGAGRSGLLVRVLRSWPAPRPGAATRLTPPLTASPAAGPIRAQLPQTARQWGLASRVSRPVGAGRRALAGRGLAPLTALRAERIDLFRLGPGFHPLARPSPPLLGTQPSPPYSKIMLRSPHPRFLAPA